MKKKAIQRNNHSKNKSRKNQNYKSGFFESLFSKKTYWPVLIIISVLAIIIYSNTFNAPFQFDDTLQILKKSRVNNITDFFSISEWIDINKRPFAFFTFAINYHFGQYNVVGYHIVNVLIHILSAIIVFFLSKFIFTNTPIGKKLPDLNTNLFALFTALIFISHPIQTQGVTYIIQRMTSLSSMFYLLSVLCYAIGRKRQISIHKNIAIIFYFLTIISGIFSLLSKQIAVTIPFAIILFEFFFIRNKQGKLFKKYLTISLTLLFTGTLIILFSGLLPAETENISRQEYFITQFRVIIKYFQLLIIPIGQNLDYYFPLSETLWAWKEIASLLSIITLIGSAIYFYKKFPIYSFGILWIIITLSVESSIIPIRDVIFEHRLYLPMFGFALIISSIVMKYIGKLSFNTSSLILITLIIIYSIFTYNRNKVWASQYSLWNDITQKSPEKPRPWYNLGKICLDEGKYNECMKYSKNSLDIDPTQTNAWYNIGLSFERLGNPQKAPDYYFRAIKEDSLHTRSMNNLGSLYIDQKEFQKAVKYLEIAYKIDKKHIILLQNLGIAYYRLGEYRNAIKYNKKL
ncbi:MAG: tetratricopeptide repeat protein, partial [Bacteroidales bacterium]|nr:tetratricopeptide repeat protein [Bacteroidales bacterium]